MPESRAGRQEIGGIWISSALKSTRSAAGRQYFGESAAISLKDCTFSKESHARSRVNPPFFVPLVADQLCRNRRGLRLVRDQPVHAVERLQSAATGGRGSRAKADRRK